jgi:O-antigen/teichoic acid export membrane protein
LQLSVNLKQLLLKDVNRTGNDNLRLRLVRSAGGTLAARIVFQGFTLFISLLLARLLGADGYGAYAYAIALVSLLSIFSMLGFDRLLVRQIAIYKMKAAWSLLRGILRWTGLIAMLMAVVFTSLILLAVSSAGERFDPQITTALRIAAFMLPFVTMARLRQAAMQGLGHLAVGQLPEMILQPILFIGLVGAAYFLWSAPDVALAMGLQLFACAVAYCCGAVQLRWKIPAEVGAARPLYLQKIWMRSALPILFIGGVGIINARVDTLMLGAMMDAASVGIYVVAARGAELILILLMAVNAALSPIIAELHESGQKEKLQALVVRGSRMVLLGALPLALMFIVQGPWLLSFFGEEFVSGYSCLAILSSSMLLHVAIGSVGPLLIMTGFEKQAALAVASGAFLNIGLNRWLIPLWGIEGAASASAMTLLFSTIILAILVYRRLGIAAHPFHRLSRSRVREA